jgi:hypothetical protein
MSKLTEIKIECECCGIPMYSKKFKIDKAVEKNCIKCCMKSADYRCKYFFYFYNII